MGREGKILPVPICGYLLPFYQCFDCTHHELRPPTKEGTNHITLHPHFLTLHFLTTSLSHHLITSSLLHSLTTSLFHHITTSPPHSSIPSPLSLSSDQLLAGVWPFLSSASQSPVPVAGSGPLPAGRREENMEEQRKEGIILI